MEKDLRKGNAEPVQPKNPAKEKIYYLKNNARPRMVTINIQRLTDYLDEDGNSWEVKVSCHRDKEEYYISPEEAKDLDDFKVAGDEKFMVWNKNGGFYSRHVVPISQTYEVMNYPHVLKFHCGKDKYDERIYSCYVGGICEVFNSDDKEHIMKTYHFIDEVDEKGALIEKNPHLSSHWNKKMNVDLNKIPNRYEEINADTLRQNPKKDRITEIKLDESMS